MCHTQYRTNHVRLKLTDSQLNTQSLKKVQKPKSPTLINNPETKPLLLDKKVFFFNFNNSRKEFTERPSSSFMSPLAELSH